MCIRDRYLFDKKTIRQQQKAMSARVEKLARVVSTKTELEKELYIHDFICENIHYDKLKKPYSHEIIGPLGHGVGAVSYTHLDVYKRQGLNRNSLKGQTVNADKLPLEKLTDLCCHMR